MVCCRSTPTAPADVVCVDVHAVPSSIDEKTAINPTLKTLPLPFSDIASSVDNAQTPILADILGPNSEKKND